MDVHLSTTIPTWSRTWHMRCGNVILQSISSVLLHMQIMAEAKELLPGGVNSPVRAFRSVGGNPIVFDRVKGPYCWDVDGNK